MAENENMVDPSAPVSESAPAEIPAGAMDELKARVEKLETANAELMELVKSLGAEIIEIKKASGKEVKPVKSSRVTELFFKEPVWTDAGPKQGFYTPASDTDFDRLKPFADKAPEGSK